MRSARATHVAIALGLMLALLPTGARSTQSSNDRPRLELEGSFAPGPLITGARLSGPYLYVTTVFELQIYDVSKPLAPRLLGSNYTDRLIHGELLATNDRIMLLNDWPNGTTVTVWDVENKEDPQPLTRLLAVPDEHFGCVLDCRWAYGSEGTILDLRRPSQAKVLDASWTEITGLDFMHRVDEFRPGFLVTAPTGEGPTVIDARRPLDPRVVARGAHSLGERTAYLYSDWTLEGDGRHMLASVERFGQRGRCTEPRATLFAFDTKGWPGDRVFERTAGYELPGSCSAYYFDLHPDFARNGLVALPHGPEGVRVLRLGSDGFRETASFFIGTGDVWHTFWLNEEILYVLNSSGQVYILRYTD